MGKIMTHHGMFGSPWGSLRLTQTQMAKLSWTFSIRNSWYFTYIYIHIIHVIHQNLGSMTTPSFSKTLIFRARLPGQGWRRESPRSHDGLRAGGNGSVPWRQDWLRLELRSHVDVFFFGRFFWDTVWFLNMFTRCCCHGQIFWGECVCKSSAPNTSRSKTAGWNAMASLLDDVVTLDDVIFF